MFVFAGAVEPNSILEQLRYIERDTLELSVRFKVSMVCRGNNHFLVYAWLIIRFDHEIMNSNFLIAVEAQ